MKFLLRKSLSGIYDAEYRFEMPHNSLIVAPLEFFAKFGPRFTDKVADIDVLIKTRPLFFAYPIPGKNKKYSVRHIGNDQIKRALSGELMEEFLNPKTKSESMLGVDLASALGNEPPPPPKVNVFKLTKSELLAKAAELNIEGAPDMSRQQLIKAVNALLGAADGPAS